MKHMTPRFTVKKPVRAKRVRPETTVVLPWSVLDVHEAAELIVVEPS